ncbi:TetR/AcrR family transcriptional regulator [Burkholderia cenocepacia]|uniref:TetR/AcrR family transcriptional regulator n=1 Tax=Burkholderia cenocepacia TaxID=95486 RepID=A0A3S9NKY0_9BURK|nr:TetR/AcrR family transcriptional regulator [Burkholderia cenocepacia]AZQ56348.1 TetR/AcrR family transcriptional regulator [Burkholderia cenocepacia]
MSVNPRNPSSSSYHHGNLRQVVLETGLSLIEQSGEPDFSVRELASLIGVTPPAVYRHFENKDALLVALAVEGFSRLTAAQADAYRAVTKRERSPRAAFVAGGSAYVEFAKAHPALFKLMFGKLALDHRGDGLLKKARQANLDATIAGIRAVLGSTSTERQVREYAIAAWSTVHGLSMLMIDRQLDVLDGNESSASAVIEWAMQGLHSLSIGK